MKNVFYERVLFPIIDFNEKYDEEINASAVGFSLIATVFCAGYASWHISLIWFVIFWGQMYSISKKS